MRTDHAHSQRAEGLGIPGVERPPTGKHHGLQWVNARAAVL
jgi:hypothetical protein